MKDTIYIFFIILFIIILKYYFVNNDYIYDYDYVIKFKILNLILYSENNEEYTKMYKILSKYLKKINVKYYFYCYKENLENDYEIIDDIIYIKGVESLVPGCLDKTLKTFTICKDMNFDYLVRSNISEVINFKLLDKFLNSLDIEYGGGTLYCLHSYLPMYGTIDEKYLNTNYIQGNAIIFNRNTFNLIESNREKLLEYNVIDDVAFGIFLKDKVKYIYHTHEKINVSILTNNIIFYRNKSLDRHNDVINMEKLTNLLSHDFVSPNVQIM